MKRRSIIVILSAFTALALYVGGYFIVVHKRLQNYFISWPIMRPLPMEADYRVNGLKIIYEPVVQFDQKLFPTRWVYPPTSKEQLQDFYKSIDFKRIREMSESPNNQIAPREPPLTVSGSNSPVLPTLDSLPVPVSGDGR